MEEGAPTPPDAAEHVLKSLPPGKTHADKHVIGIAAPGGELVGVLDLIRDYPGERDTRAHWGAMPLLWAGNGFVQVFTDVTSENRLFVTYAADGHVLRKTLLQAPLALVAEREPRYLLGIRRAGGTEIVGYQWRWTSK